MKRILTLLLITAIAGSLSAQGNVGIGTSTPNQTLDVNGWIKVADQNAAVPPNSNDEGSLRYNSTSKRMEFNDGGTSGDWEKIASAYDAVPVGVICMWNGSKAAIPSGWALCDGTNGTPNLLDKFVLSVSLSAYTAGDINITGGNHNITLNTTQLPSHTHTGTSDAGGDHNHGGTSGSESAHTHGVGTYVAAAESAHTHGVGTYVAAVESAHTHGIGSYTAAAESAHTHGVGTIATASAGGHSHNINNISSQYWGNTYQSFQGSLGGNSGQTHGTTDTQGAHTHTMSGSTAAGSSHTHALSGTSGAGSSHTHTLSGTSGAGSSHTHTLSGTSGAGSSHNHTISASGTHTHTFTTNATGSGASIDIRPAYYKLAYIMKL